MFRPAAHLALLAAAALLCAPGMRAADASDPLQTAISNLQHGNFPAAEQQLRAQLRLHPADARLLSLIGVALDGQKKYAEAEDFHRRAAAAAPRSAEVLDNQGNHFLAAGDEKNAREAYRNAVAADPADATANLNLARFALRTQDGAEALGYLNRLPPDRQKAPQVAVLMAESLYLAHKNAEADAVVDRLTAAAKADPSLAYSLGMALGSAGQFDKSETFLSTALSAAPTDFNLLYHVGVAASRAGHNERALEAIDAALREQPDSVDALYAEAWAEEGLGKRTAAIPPLVHALKLAPRRADIQKLLAIVTSELKAWHDAADAWNRYLELVPGDEEARRERGLAVARTGQFEEGEADIDWYLERHPDDATGHYELGLALLDEDQTRALSELDKAVSLKPDFAEARSTRGSVYYQQGKADVALADLEFAAAHLPSDAVTLDRLGQAYAALDRSADAVKALSEAVKLDPSDSTMQLHYARALADSGRTKEYEAAMDRFRQMDSARKSAVPAGFVDYLGMTPEERRANYRQRVEETIAKNPTDGPAQLRDLQLELDDGHMDRAADAARRIAALKPDPALFSDAGRALLGSNQNALAKDLLQRAMAAAPAPSPDLQLDLAIAVFRADGAAAGLARLDDMPETGRDGDYYLARAQMLNAAGKRDEAASSLEMALRASPKRADLYWQTAAVLTADRKSADALKLLDRAAAGLPDAREIPLAKAIVLELSGQTVEASKAMEAVRVRWPEWPAVWVARGIALNTQGDFVQASQSLQTAASLGARGAEAYYYLADSLLRGQPAQVEAAAKASAQALALAPSDPWLQVLAGRVALQKGNHQGAVGLFEQATRLRPEWALPHKLLAQAYQALGRKDEAAAELRKAQSSSVKDESPAYLAELFQSIPPNDW
ncbi:MAG TPA: tetratricopeptide repeat protein [Bryobacteraceae bacterium]|nr:tetratricopeptide repeat protein [Bryobacteraceae bacterium]